MNNMALQILTNGHNNVRLRSYTLSILHSQDLGVASNPYVGAILTGLIRLIGSLIGTILLKKYKRTVLMTGSAFAMAFVLTALALTVYFKDTIQGGIHKPCGHT